MRTLRQPLDHRLEQLLGGPLTGNFQKELCQRLELRPVIGRQLHTNIKELPADLSTHPVSQNTGGEPPLLYFFCLVPHNYCIAVLQSYRLVAPKFPAAEFVGCDGTGVLPSR